MYCHICKDNTVGKHDTMIRRYLQIVVRRQNGKTNKTAQQQTNSYHIQVSSRMLLGHIELEVWMILPSGLRNICVTISVNTFEPQHYVSLCLTCFVIFRNDVPALGLDCGRYVRFA